MKGVQVNSKRAIRLWGGVALLLLLVISFRLFLINTYYIGAYDDLPNGISPKSLMVVALHGEPTDSDDLLIIELYDENGLRKLLPARLLHISSVKQDEELLVDIGTSDIWILREQVHGKVITQIRLP